MRLRRRARGVRAEELSRALGEVERHRRFISAIFDSIDVGLVLLDEHGAYQTMNHRHEDFMRLAYPDGHAGMAGQTGAVYAEDGATPMDRSRMPSLRAAAGEEFDDVRIWVGADPLTRRALSVSARTVRDDRGGFRGAALSYKDVTDYLVAMQVKDQFVATVSHEFRTPLTSIHGYVALLLDESDRLPAEAAASLGVVQRNTERLHRLVSDLLLTASVDHQHVDLVRSVTELGDIVRTSAESQRPVAERSGVRITVETPAYLAAMTDPQRFAQVVDNLVSNAVKYTLPGGCVRVVLAAHAEQVELAVSDDGIGIAEEDQQRLFSRFFRSSDAEERSIQGIGLGLSIVKQIVDLLGGRILVESALGRGSTFRVVLPAAALVVPDDYRPPQSA